MDVNEPHKPPAPPPESEREAPLGREADSAPAAPDAPAEPESSLPRRMGTLVRSVLGGVRRMGQDVAAVVRGRKEECESEAGELTATGEDPQPAPEKRRRIRMLHTLAEQLRGAADSYVAVKLDEIEARVDEKLDHIEKRIDRKILDLHEQLIQLRDAELRHRLRLLKVTLIFTALVAVLSLVYKWVSRWWLSA